MYFYVENIKDEPIDLVSNQRIFRDHLVLKKNVCFDNPIKLLLEIWFLPSYLALPLRLTKQFI
jgi:hypothetical protein